MPRSQFQYAKKQRYSWQDSHLILARKQNVNRAKCSDRKKQVSKEESALDQKWKKHRVSPTANQLQFQFWTEKKALFWKILIVLFNVIMFKNRVTCNFLDRLDGSVERGNQYPKNAKDVRQIDTSVAFFKLYGDFPLDPEVSTARAIFNADELY